MDISNLKVLSNGAGSYGKCYIVDKNTLYKSFFLDSRGRYPFKPGDFEGKINIENDSFVFPKELDTKYGMVKGYTMDWIHAPSLEELDYDYSILNFIYALGLLEIDLKDRSLERIKVHDISEFNILYDDKLHFIDTDFYDSDLTTNDKYDIEPSTHNERAITVFLYEYFIGRYSFSSLSSIIQEDDELNDLDKEVGDKLKLSYLRQLLYEIKDVISSMEDREIVDFKDLYNVVTRKI